MCHNLTLYFIALNQDLSFQAIAIPHALCRGIFTPRRFRTKAMTPLEALPLPQQGTKPVGFVVKLK
jgi:hypothetical protein